MQRDINSNDSTIIYDNNLENTKLNIKTSPIDLLKQWSGKDQYTVIFDSDRDGDGSNNELPKIVKNKKNLYFISFDFNGNIYGGYVDSTINKIGSYITDSNAFVFSLLRNWKIKNMKYSIQSDREKDAFLVWNDSSILYHFGGYGVIFISKVGQKRSYSNPSSTYLFNDDKSPFVYGTDDFEIMRYIIIQMD
ncbi:TLDc domain-containing protein [Entamoeba marina]